MDSKRIGEKFWSFISSIRETGIDYQVLLIILILYKKDVLKKFINSDSQSFIDTVHKSIDNFSGLERDVLYDGIRFFENDLQKLTPRHFYDLNHILREYDEDFYRIFDELLFKLEEIMGKSSGGYIQPEELTHLMLNLADIKQGDKVYNPFAGLVSFGVKLEKDISYFAQEINEQTYVKGQLRLMAYNKLNKVEFSRQDSIEFWPEHTKFDSIVSSPPISYRIRNKYPEVESRSIEEFFLKKSVDSLKNTGKGVALVSNGVLFRSGQENELREWLIEEDLIESIISLPKNILTNTSIQTNIIVLSKKKDKKGIVKFLDASSLYSETKGRTNKLNVGQVTSIYQSSNNSENTRFVSLSEIKANDYDLSVSRYFVENITKEFEGVELGEILYKANVEKVKSEDKVPYMKIGDLNDNEMGVYSDTSEIEKSIVKRGGFKVNEPVLLLAIRFKNLKPTILDSSPADLIISNDIKAFTVDTNKVDLGYLVFELRKDYVQEQVIKYQSGTTMPYLSVDDLFKIKIKLPSKDQQRQDLLDAINDRAKNELNKYSKELSEMRTEMFREFSSTRHSVKQYLNSIRGGVNGLQKFISKNDGQKISLTDVYSKNLGKTLAEHLERLIEDTAAASGLLDKLETPFLNRSKKEFNIVDLTKQVIKKIHGSKEFEYKFNIDEESFSQGDDQELKPIIEINKDDYIKLIQNIVDNACHHGFSSDSNNIIRIEATSINEGKDVLLEISNNGRPFDEKFTEERLKIRGEKSVSSKSTGNGGADIDQITKMYEGTFSMSFDKDSEFPVTYKIQFPIKFEDLD